MNCVQTKQSPDILTVKKKGASCRFSFITRLDLSLQKYIGIFKHTRQIDMDV